MSDHTYEFFGRLARILNAGVSRSLILYGNIYDLFWNGSQYVPLIPFLCDRSKASGIVQLVYELNGPIRTSPDDRTRLQDAWVVWKSGLDINTLVLKDLDRRPEKSEVDRLRAEFNAYLHDAIGNPTQALEFMRQLTICSRAVLRGNLLIITEGADMLLPAGNGDVSTLNDRQLRRISIVQDWFGDPAFVNGRDSVCLIAESRSLVHPRIARLPQVAAVEIPSPSTADRRHYIDWYSGQSNPPPRLWAGSAELAAFSAGLSNYAQRQLLVGATYANETMTPMHVVAKVEEFIQAQLGEDVVEFKKPSHRLSDVIGFSALKKFLRDELIPRFRAEGDKALPGAAVAGAIGGGKTFIFEAVAAELDMPVLVLKSIRSQWYGQTDVIFERLRRVLEALEKVVIFVDEADTQFGGVDEGTHETERRLTGKIQAMMSDPKLRGKVFWLLMTARIHRLSPDIRRPGRVGDLIIPVLDPTGEDRQAFVDWVATAFCPRENAAFAELAAELEKTLPPDCSAASFASLRSHIKARSAENVEQVLEVIRDHIPPAIGLTRKYQTLQALVNCTRRSLLPNPNVTEETRTEWERQIRLLETHGIR